MEINMKDKLKIRKAELRDARTVAQFNIQIAKETENLDLEPETALRGAKAVIKDPHKGFYLVAETKGEIVGQLMVTNEWSDWRNKFFLWIQSVFVHKDYRQQGIFSALYRHLVDLARFNKNVAGLRLYVEQTNETAIEVYERLGMQPLSYRMYEVLR